MFRIRVILLHKQKTAVESETKSQDLREVAPSSFFRRENLRSTRRRSASCPNLEQISVEDEQHENNTSNNEVCESSSESDWNENNSASKFERLKAQRSIRRVRLKEREKKECAEKNLISMDDYLGKLSELKTWLREERKKDVETMGSPKLKAHFRTFMKLWNKRKLPAKYYRGCLTELGSEDNGLKRDERIDAFGSPFSTFGKSGDLLSSPAVLAEQVNFAATFAKWKGETMKEDKRQINNEYLLERSSPNVSSPKFATISRSTPASSLYKFTAQPWTSRGDFKSHPVSSPKCPDLQGHLETSLYSKSHTTSSTHQCSSKPESVKDEGSAEKQTFSTLKKSSGPSPVYCSTVDAIPYSTGSPKYAEVDESICSPSWKQPPSDYCSLSPLKECKATFMHSHAPSSKKQPLSRRLSKSLEDLYSVPVKADTLRRDKIAFNKEDLELSTSPKVPDRKYSPVVSSIIKADCKGQTCPFSERFEECDHSSYDASPSTKAAKSPLSSPPENNAHKRCSQESMESLQHSTSSLKKIKSTCSSIYSDFDENLMLSMANNSDLTPQKLSILTGSQNPTTRSRYKLHEGLNSPPTNDPAETKSSETRLSLLEIKQLNESPKLPRRRLKRRSSSLTTTPGKGLTFGKASKMSAPSPRRVSFAKNVKETEKSAQRKALRDVPQYFTKQTQERKQFESFLSSHSSPPRKSNSPKKTASPDKNSLPKASSPPKGDSPHKYDARATCLDHENTPRQRILASTFNGGNVDYSQHNTDSLSDNRERLFPSASTRQVGRRVIGAPKASSGRNIGVTNQVLSSLKNPENCVSPQNSVGVTHPALSPKKNLGIRSHVSSTHCGLAALSQDVSSPENLGTAFQIKCLQKNDGTAFQLVSRDKVVGRSVKTPPAASSDSFSQKQLRVVASQKHFTSPPKSNSPPKEFISQIKSQPVTKKLFDFPASLSVSKVSIPSLVSRLTEKTTTICAREVSASEESLSSNEILNTAPPLSVLPSSHAHHQDPDLFTDSSNILTEKHGLQKGIEDYAVTVLENSFGNNLNETANRTSRSSATSEIQSTFEPGSSFNLALSTPTILPDIEGSSLVSHVSVEGSSPLTDFHSEANCVQEIQKEEYIPVKLPAEEFCSNISVTSERKLVSSKSYGKTACSSVSQQPLLQNKPQSKVTVAENKGNKVQTNSLRAVSKKGPSPQALTSSSKFKNNQERRCLKSVKFDNCEKEAKCSSLPVGVSAPVRGDLVSAPSRVDLLPAKNDVTEDVSKFQLSSSRVQARKKETMECFPSPVISIKAEHQQLHSSQDNWNVEKEMSSQSKFSDTLNTLSADDKNKKDIQESDNMAKERFVYKSSSVSSRDMNGKPPLHVNTEHSVDKHQNNVSQSSAEKEFQCDLKRLSSIRSSPKIVENDGWITERRRSNRGKKLHSFRSAYNRYLLKSTSSDEIEVEEKDRLQGKDNLEVMPGFFDHSTENISQEIKGTIQDTLSQKSSLTNSEDTKPAKNDEYCLNPGQNSAVPPQTKMVTSKVKTKPPILPKPCKTSAHRSEKLNTLRITASSTNKPELKTRRSSLTKRRSSGRRSSHGKDVPVKHVSDDKTGDKLSGGKGRIGERLSGGKNRSGEKLSSGNGKSEEQLSSGIDASTTGVAIELVKEPRSKGQEEYGGSDLLQTKNKMENYLNSVDSRKVTTSSECKFRSEQSGKTARKRSSGRVGDRFVDRRRSKDKSTTEESKVLSFADRRRFFQQLHVNTQSSVKCSRPQTGLQSAVRRSPQKQSTV